MRAKTVLVASAAPDVRDRFFVALGGAGHQALGAGDWRELRALLDTQSDRIDLLVLDTRLGAGSAAQVLERLRRVIPATPVLVCGGALQGARDVAELAALGVAGYINEHADVQRILPALAPALFPSNFDRRTSARVTLDIPAALATGAALLPVFTLNIGSGGMAVRAAAPLSAGTQVGVRFTLPRSEHAIAAPARVVWSQAAQGALGLQFETVAAEDQIAIDEFVEQRSSSGPPVDSIRQRL